MPVPRTIENTLGGVLVICKEGPLREDIYLGPRGSDFSTAAIQDAEIGSLPVANAIDRGFARIEDREGDGYDLAGRRRQSKMIVSCIREAVRGARS